MNRLGFVRHSDIAAFVWYLAIALLLTSALPAAADSTSGQGRPVPPGYHFVGRYLNLAAPNSDGWLLTSAQPSLWTFAKHGSEPDESYIASISILHFPAAISRDDFIALIRKKAEHDESLSCRQTACRRAALTLDVPAAESSSAASFPII